MTTPLLLIDELEVEYATRMGRTRSLDGASLEVAPGQVVGVVGESGSGKSTLGACVGRLLPANAERVGGAVHIDGRSVFDLNVRDLRELRRTRLAFIFQSPIAALDPTMRIGRQIRLAAPGVTDEEIRSSLREVGLDATDRVLRAFPHQLSGGMAQRVAITQAMLRQPALLVADEPTASLDRSVRDKIMRLLVALSRQHGVALLVISHDLTSIGQFCDLVAVMYGGRVVEQGPPNQLLQAPLHPYTRMLLQSAPGKEEAGSRLAPIPGAPPLLTARSDGCAFAPRCPLATEACSERPELSWARGHRVSCHHVEDLEELTHDG